MAAGPRSSETCRRRPLATVSIRRPKPAPSRQSGRTTARRRSNSHAPQCSPGRLPVMAGVSCVWVLIVAAISFEPVEGEFGKAASVNVGGGQLGARRSRGLYGCAAQSSVGRARCAGIRCLSSGYPTAAREVSTLILCSVQQADDCHGNGLASSVRPSVTQ